MRKIELQANRFFNGEHNVGKILLRHLLYITAGAGLYVFLSWLSFAPRQFRMSDVTFRPGTVILVLFGLFYGPWIGLLTGVVGKTVADVVGGWGFYWNGSLAYGLIGFVPGLIKLVVKNWIVTKNILSAMLLGVLGVLAGALFLALSAAYLGDIHLSSTLRAFFLPEFLGNLVVIIIFLPLLILAIAAIGRKWNL